MPIEEKLAAARKDTVRGLFDALCGEGSYYRATSDAPRSAGQLDSDVKLLRLATTQVSVTLDAFLSTLKAHGVELTEAGCGT